MAEKEMETPRPRRWRRWLKRIGLTLFALFVLLAIFHRPIIFRGTKYFAVRLAKEQKLALDYEIHGTIFTTLSITTLRAKPTEPGPVERLEIGTLNLRYSLIGLIRKGLPGVLKDLDLREAYIVVDPSKIVPKEKLVKEQKGAKFPAVFPERLNISNVNFISRGANGDMELAGVYFSLDPVTPGVLKIQTLDIPGVRKWSDISANATFRERNLVLTDVVLGPEIALKTFNLNASKLDAGEIGLGLDGALFGAATSLAARVTDLNKSNHLNARAECAGLAFDEVWKYLNMQTPLHGSLTQFAMTFDGAPEKPRDWSGKIETQLDGLVFDKQQIGAVAATVDLGSGRANVAMSDQFDDKNKVALNAEAALPEKLDGFVKTTASGRLDLLAPDLATLTKPLAQPVSGDLAASVDFKLNNGQLVADTTLDSAQLAASGAELTKTSFAIHVEKNIIGQKQPMFADLVTQTHGSIARLRFKDYTADGLVLALANRGADVTLQQFTLSKATNSVGVQGSYTLPDDLKSWQSKPLEADVNIAAPDLSAFVVPGSVTKLSGELSINGTAEMVNGKYNGAFAVAGKAIYFNELTLRDLGGDVNIIDSVAHLPNFGVYLDAKNYVNLGAEVGLEAPQKYSAWIEAKLTDLSAFEPLLAKPEKKTPLAGALAISWKGSGEIAPRDASGKPLPPRHLGDGSVMLERARFDTLEGLGANIVADYDAPAKINISMLRVAAKGGELQAKIALENSLLKIDGIDVRQGKLALLAGSIQVPIDLTQTSNPDLLVPDNGPVKIVLTSKDVDLAKLFTQLGQKKPPMTGTLTTNISADGTIKTLVANVSVRGSKLQAASAAKIPPADLELDLNLKDNRLALGGNIRQREIQPLHLSGDLPLDVAALKKAKALDRNTPVKLNVTLPRSSLGFVSSLAPQIRFIKGTAAIDVKVGGTIGRPDISGSIQSDIANLRMTDTSLPTVNNTIVRMNFTRDQLTISQFKGGLAGGSFGASGNIQFTKLTEPVFDMRVGTNKALVMQNDNVTARVTSDLKIAGPLNAGTVSGTVFVTKSRYFKDIDVLPIGLPGRPAPQPPPEPSVVSFPNPPLRDWKFDIAIKTEDPFLIQGNLTNGGSVIDLKLAGTGLKPYMTGSVQIRDLTASLPFSRLEIPRGLVYFTADAPFVPKFEIRGTSVIRDYNIDVYVYGTASDPHAIFTSEPPLPQSEIVSLLATGVTTKELAGDPNVLAGRAAILVVQKYYRKIFKKNAAAQPKESFMNRVQFDVGATDPQTGKQSLAARFKLSDEVVLTGGVGVGGDFRGMVKYLVRFH